MMRGATFNASNVLMALWLIGGVVYASHASAHLLHIFMFSLFIDYILLIWVDMEFTYSMHFSVDDFMHVVVPWKLMWWLCMMIIFMMIVFHIVVATIGHAFVLKMVDHVMVLLSLHHDMLLSIFGYFLEPHNPYDGFFCYHL